MGKSFMHSTFYAQLSCSSFAKGIDALQFIFSSSSDGKPCLYKLHTYRTCYYSPYFLHLFPFASLWFRRFVCLLALLMLEWTWRLSTITFLMERICFILKIYRQMISNSSFSSISPRSSFSCRRRWSEWMLAGWEKSSALYQSFFRGFEAVWERNRNLFFLVTIIKIPRVLNEFLSLSKFENHAI